MNLHLGLIDLGPELIVYGNNCCYDFIANPFDYF